MRIEYAMLGATLILALVHIFAPAYYRTKQYGLDWNMGARDAPQPALDDPVGGRLVRAQANLYETLPLFIGALLGAAMLGRFGWKTSVGASCYFFGRLAYLPIYAAGIPKLRSLVWGVAFAGLILLIWALLLG